MGVKPANKAGALRTTQMDSKRGQFVIDQPTAAALMAPLSEIVAEAGADILGSGSGVFPDHVAANLKKLREVAERSAHRRS